MTEAPKGAALWSVFNTHRRSQPFNTLRRTDKQGAGCTVPVTLLVLLSGLLWYQLAFAGSMQTAPAPVVFLGNQSLPPMVYVKDGSPTGVVVDVVRALGKRMARPIEIRCMDWATAQATVSNGDADALIQINPTEERRTIYDFSEPLLESQFSIFVSSDRVGVSGVNDLRGLRVGVEKKGLPAQILSSDPQIIVHIIPDFLQGFRMLKQGTIDAVVVDQWVGAYVVAENKIDDVRITGEPILILQSAIAVKKGNSELLADINRGLREIKADGTFSAVLAKWQPSEILFETREQRKFRLYKVSLYFAVALFTLAVIWGIVLHVQVARRKKAECLATEEKERLRLATNAGNIGVWDWDVVQNRLTWDDSMYTLYGIRKEDFGGAYEAWSHALHPEDRQSAEGEIHAALSGERDYAPEFRIVQPGGAVRIIKAESKTIRDQNGKVLRLIGINIDITERKRAEEELARINAALEAKNAELEQVVYVTSHDLRSPLVNIDGYSKELGYAIDNLRRTLADIPVAEQTHQALNHLMEEEISEALRFIQASTFKMQALLTGLLRLSRSGREALTIETLDMNRLVSTVVDATEYMIKAAGITLEVTDLPPCQGDAAQVDQVFSNLLDNAIKYLDPGRPGVIRISGRVERKRSVYCVEDNGIGIAPDHLNAIFQIFLRLDPTRSAGEGLGLSIVKRILARLGGDVWVESKVGSGSRFYVALPTQ